MELINLGAALIGGIQGQVASLSKNYFESKKFKAEMKYNSVKDARYSALNNNFFMSIQMIIGVMIISYVCVAPYVAAYLKIPISMAYTETNGPVHWFFSGFKNILWYKIDGFPIGPVHCYLAGSFCFYLMGNMGRR